MIVLLAHHELAASISAYAIGLSGASVALLWRASTRPAVQRVRDRLRRRTGPTRLAARRADGR
jgi:hypothetical protein